MVIIIALILGNTNNLQIFLKKIIFKFTTKVKLIFLRPLKKLKTNIYMLSKQTIESRNNGRKQSHKNKHKIYVVRSK